METAEEVKHIKLALLKCQNSCKLDRNDDDSCRVSQTHQKNGQNLLLVQIPFSVIGVNLTAHSLP